MIIVPTEKRFDWKHPPIALFSIVFLNVLVFFLYQSGDNRKYQEAYQIYMDANLFVAEWPAYESYLKETGREDELLDLDYTVGREVDGDLAVKLMLDFGFASYLNGTGRTKIPIEDYAEWKVKRKQVNDILAEVSSVRFGLIPKKAELITFITSQFLHGDLMHLVGNLFFLVLCGFAVEAALGARQFAIFYLLSGIAAALLFTWVDSNSAVPLVGASGSISGVMAMYLMIFRLQKIEFFYWLLVFVGYIRLPALAILPVYIGKELVSYYTDTNSNVAFMAHTGGFIAGALLIGATLVFRPQTIDQDYIEAEDDSDYRREQLSRYFALLEKYNFQSALKVLNELIKNEGADFELLKLKYNLLKLNPGKNCLQCILQLISLPHLQPQHYPKLESIWLENPPLKKFVQSELKLKLGWRFIGLNNNRSAEDIMIDLYRTTPGLDHLDEFARALAKSFKQLGDLNKAKKYTQLAKSLA